MPIQPTGFDCAFHALGIGFTTLRQCSLATPSPPDQEKPKRPAINARNPENTFNGSSYALTPFRIT